MKNLVSSHPQNHVVEYQKANQNSQLAEVPAGAYGEISLGSLFPVASDGCSCRTRVGIDQIAWPNCSCQVGAFWQMLTLVARGEDAGVSSWSGSRPAGDLFSTCEIQGQRVTSVDSCNLAHGHSVGSEYVFDGYQIFAHLNPRKPKEQQGQVANENHQGSALQNSVEAICRKDPSQCESHGGDYDNRKCSCGFSNKDLHPTSVAVNGRVFA